eukprot:Blabericola_migrator_1__1096@NODE_127_length_13302_cov_126_428410_g112_i0_p3_GENE_NODE_127_length_13302_cov_126_428410_g112_i0NODE_127_length_13302_cov_126_428410_g112_i0_p3_ORF_typecomplete_len509_score96_29GSH_synth_ATP/PF03917_17/1_1e97GSH_synthase/PF03199_15/6e13_NODE_127_length_13302_cov_126_428410_g112_i01177613257
MTWPAEPRELAGYKGLSVLSEDGKTFTTAPATLFPTLYPRSCYQHAVSLAAPFNELCDSMVLHTDWLINAYKEIVVIDDFVEHFVDITRRVYVDGPKDITRCLRAYVTRSDYLYYKDGDLNKLGQVEINLSSVVGPDVMEQLTDFHRDMMINFGPDNVRLSLPENKPLTEFGKFIARVPPVYNAKFPLVGHKSIVIFVSGDFERNWPEIQAEIRAVRSHGVWVYQMTFSKLVALFKEGKARIVSHKETHRLLIDAATLRGTGLSHTSNQDLEVCCVYFRTAYRPEQLPTEDFWIVREQLELSEAVVIPSAISQLAGLKKVQQLWCEESHLSLLVQDPLKRLLLRSCFVDQVDPSQYSIDPHVRDVVHEALEHPERFVLKPQREGGANNFYKADIPPLLRSEIAQRVSSYILMRKIEAVTTITPVCEKGGVKIYDQESVSELGIYAAGLWDGPHCVYNEAIGHLLRTKVKDADEGGVSVNASVFDSVNLFNDCA